MVTREKEAGLHSHVLPIERDNAPRLTDKRKAGQTAKKTASG